MAANDEAGTLRPSPQDRLDDRLDDPFEDELEETALEGEEEEPRRRASKLLPILVATLALIGFVAIVWYAYTKGIEIGRGGGSETTPTLRADDTPPKRRPDQPGGLDVPHQDKEVYQRIGGGGTPPKTAERLLPNPEPPLPRPTAPASAEPLAPPASPHIPAPPPLPGTVTATVLTPPGTPPRPLEPRSATNAPPAPPPAAPPADDGSTPRIPAPRPAVATAPTPIAPPLQAPFGPPRPTTPAQATRPPATLAPTPAPTANVFRVQLVAAKSVEEARLYWEAAKKRHGELIGNLTPETQRIVTPTQGEMIRLLVGPFATKAEATKLCDALKARKQDCIVR